MVVGPPSLAWADEERTVAGDLTSPWFHVGGGAALQFPFDVESGFGEPIDPAGRLTIGGGWYTFMFYVGGGADFTFGPLSPFQLSGVVTLGMAIPVPVMHPLIGFRAGGGPHLSGDPLLPNADPHWTLGPQIGFILRTFDGKPGFRLMFDFANVGWPEQGRNHGEFTVTAAGVF